MPKVIGGWIEKTNSSKKNDLYSGIKIEDLFAGLFAFMRNIRARESYFWATSVANRAFSYFSCQPDLFWGAKHNNTPEDYKNTDDLLKFFREEYKPNYLDRKTTNMLTVLKNDLVARKHYKFVKQAFAFYIFKNSARLYPKPEIVPVIPTPKPVYFKTVVPAQMAVTQVPVAPIVNSFIGEPEKPLPIDGKHLDLKVKFAKMLSSKFGRFCLTVMKDSLGREIVYGSKHRYNVGDNVRIKSATVKKHSIYKDVKQTVIGNVKF